MRNPRPSSVVSWCVDVAGRVANNSRRCAGRHPRSQRMPCRLDEKRHESTHRAIGGEPSPIRLLARARGPARGGAPNRRCGCGPATGEESPAHSWELRLWSMPTGGHETDLSGPSRGAERVRMPINGHPLIVTLRFRTRQRARCNRFEPGSFDGPDLCAMVTAEVDHRRRCENARKPGNRRKQDIASTTEDCCPCAIATSNDDSCESRNREDFFYVITTRRSL